MIGRTSVIGRDGLVLADLGRSIGVLTIDLDLANRRVTPFYFNTPMDRTLAVIASRRPELYRDLADESYQLLARNVVRKMHRKKGK